MFYSSKNTRVSLNGRNFLASKASIGVANSIEPLYMQNQRVADSYVATNGLQGSLKLDYYLTGQDYLKDFFTNERGLISGNFGGLYFRSGVLKSYSFNAALVGPLSISAEIGFFEDIKGTFNPVAGETGSFKPLNFSDMVISNLSNYNTENFTNFLSASYRFSSQAKPVYYQTSGNSTSPASIIFKEKESSAEIIVDNVSGKLGYSGELAGITFTFIDPTSQNRETYTCSGYTTQRELSASVGQNVLTNISIIQANLNGPPSITSFFPETAAPGERITLLGNGFLNIIEVKFNDRTANFTIQNDSTIIATVPIDAISGPIYVKSHQGSSRSSSNFTLRTPVVNIERIEPNMGISGSMVQVWGSNFYRVETVQFGGINASFDYVNPNLIKVTVPTGDTKNPITIASTARNYSVNTPYFIPIPSVSDFTLKTGVAGNTIKITGDYFYNTPGLKTYFNDIPATTTYVSLHGVTAVVPNGNVFGPIKVVNDFGEGLASRSIFEPVVSITGIFPNTQTGNGYVRISGSNLLPELLHLEPRLPLENSDRFRVSFNGAITGFEILDSNTLGGYVPSTATTGPVYVGEPNGVSLYNTSVNFYKRNDRPYITSISISGVYSGSGLSMTIYGKNLFDISGILLTGTNPGGGASNITNIGTGVRITGRYIYSDILGNRVQISNFPTVDAGQKKFVTGRYDLLFSGYEGVCTATGNYSGFWVRKLNNGQKPVNWSY